MGDFLSRLVDRTLQRLPVLEPRRPSLFEPRATRFKEPAALVEENAERIGVDHSRSRHKRHHVEPVTQAPQAKAALPPVSDGVRVQPGAVKTQLVKEIIIERSRKSLDADSAAHSVRQNKAETFDQRDLVPPQKRLATNAYEPVSASLAATIVERSYEPLPGPRGAVQRDEVDPPSPATAMLPRPQAVSPPMVIKTVRSDRLSQPEKSVKPGSPAINPAPNEREPQTTGRPIEPVSPSVRAAEFKRTLPVQESTRPATPTVQVTIGRVEVRATYPVSPPPAMRSRAPRMSLDDYLRSRAGGVK